MQWTENTTSELDCCLREMLNLSQTKKRIDAAENEPSRKSDVSCPAEGIVPAPASIPAVERASHLVPIITPRNLRIF